MKITQKKVSLKVEFDFHDEHFLYTINSNGNTSQSKIRYTSVPFDEKYDSEERNQWYRNAGILWLGLGIFGTCMNFSDGRHQISFWAFIGAACLLAFKFSTKKFTRIPIGDGSIFIVRGTHHDEIIDKIESKRKELILRDHESINLENDPNTEINKFIWLKEIGLLSEEEARKKIDLIKYSVASQNGGR